MELKNFCSNYRTWKWELDHFNLNEESPVFHKYEGRKSINDPTGNKAMLKAGYIEKINMVKSAAKEADSEIWKWILHAVIDNLTYEYMKYQMGMKIDRDTFYDRRAKFYWILDKKRA